MIHANGEVEHRVFLTRAAKAGDELVLPVHVLPVNYVVGLGLFLTRDVQAGEQLGPVFGRLMTGDYLQRN